MILKKIQSEHLGHYSYFIGSNGEAAIIDPRRDHQIYLDLARKNEMSIRYVFETHRNEDYIIGSKEIKEKTGATILHGNQLDFTYGAGVKENDIFQLGSLELEILETPGHTDESISISVKKLDVSPKILLVFTGDTLFAGDTGRIDLYGDEEKERLAEKLFYSIHNKILPLGDDVIICPAHGKGSVCGANIGDAEYSTIGFEKKTNSQLTKNKQDFINKKKSELHNIPPYFSKMELENKHGPNIKHQLPYLHVLSLEEFKEMRDQQYQILDIRYPTSFSSAHIPGSLNIWAEGLPLFAGWFLSYEKPIIIVDEDNSNIQNVTRYLFQLGYDNIQGYLQNGFSTWYTHNEPIESIDIWTSQHLYDQLDNPSTFIVDIRDESSRKTTGYIKNSHHIFVGNIHENLSAIPRNKTIILYCDSGKKTSIGCSILKKHNYDQIINLLGGIAAWKQGDFPLEQ